MSKLSKIWVFSDSSERLAEIISGGLQLGEEVSVFIIGSQEDIALAYSFGADEVYYLGEEDSSRIVESYAQTIAEILEKFSTKALMLMPGTRRCKALASLLGAKLDVGVVTEVSELLIEDNSCKCRRMVYGGLAIGQEVIETDLGIAVLTGGVFEVPEEPLSKEGEAIHVNFVEPGDSVKCIERRPKQGSNVDLNKAKRIVSVGRGFACKDDISLAQSLADTIEAELACSRPIAETEKWMDHERYIGISNVIAKPDVYMAIGISGQIQHMVGSKDSHTIVAINKDKNAPIFDYADYGIVGDLYTVVPAMIEAFKK